MLIALDTGVPIPPSIRAFWSVFTSTIGQDGSDRFYEAFHFGDRISLRSTRVAWAWYVERTG